MKAKNHKKFTLEQIRIIKEIYNQFFFEIYLICFDKNLNIIHIVSRRRWTETTKHEKNCLHRNHNTKLLF
jgi:hypothetical protein